MLNVGKIEEGLVLDHIKAGKSLAIYNHLGLDKLPYPVAIIKNARSNAMGKKDILKMECDPDLINLDVIAFIDPRITVNVIKNGEIVEKKALSLPSEVVNVISCTNPRCITSTEHSLPQIFTLADKKRMIYRCRYCEDRYHDRGDRSWYRK
ncbi:MAG: aspartate carbamoyltransferase regulatory subunit [Lachnospiraceae bacterium]|jgi:aspartate carbamoyltransferase regulatory subunit|nr:aspartate carbamoyltransferase regulatory subunit [Lachnospiraceae bacterium]